MVITIREITEENWLDAIRLRVKEDQGKFVASNAASIAQSKFHPFIECYGIYSDDEMVGFSAVGQNPADKTVWIVRHMVDAAHQGQGYGKAGLKKIIEHLRGKFSCSEIFLDVAPANKIATELYKGAGFRITDKTHGKSPIYKLNLGEYSTDY